MRNCYLSVSVSRIDGMLKKTPFYKKRCCFLTFGWKHEHFNTVSFSAFCTLSTQTYSLTHAHYAVWHVGWLQRIATSVGAGPASGWYPKCVAWSWALPPQFGARCFLVFPSCAFLQVSSERPCEWCCPAFSSISSFCSIHLHRLPMRMVSILSWLQRASSCWLEMVWGQKICRILLRFFVWKTDSLVMSLSIILQHSEPYSRVDITQLW